MESTEDRLDRISIRNWAEEDRPREKLVLKGKASLSDAELLGILIGSGTRSMIGKDQVIQHWNIQHASCFF